MLISIQPTEMCLHRDSSNLYKYIRRHNNSLTSTTLYPDILYACRRMSVMFVLLLLLSSSILTCTHFMSIHIFYASCTYPRKRTSEPMGERGSWGWVR